MTTVFNNFESPSAGTTLTTGNTSNGDGSAAFDAFSVPGTSTLVTDATHVAHGSLALKVATGATATQTYASWGSSTAPFTSANGTIWGRVYCYFTANPSSGFPIVQLLDSGTNFGGRVTINSSGKVVMNFGGSNSVATTSTNAIPLNQWFRLEFKLVCSNTVGQTEVKIFTTSADATSPDETNTSTANLDTTITACQGARVGLCANTASLGPAWLDSAAFSNTGYIGPLSTTVLATGSVANVTLAAPAGTVSARVIMAGSVAGITLGALTGAAFGGKNFAGSVANITLTAPLGSVNAGGGAPLTVLLAGTPGNITAAAPLGHLVIVPHQHLFRTPTVKQRPVDPEGERLWLYYGIDVGISVIKRQDGTYYQQQWPTPEEMDAAAAVYMGGHEYIVDDAEYQSLVAAGYLPFFPLEGGDGSYGSGPFGAGNFGG